LVDSLKYFYYFTAMKAVGVLKLVIATCALSLIAGPLSSATSAPAAQVITCVDLVSGKERISKTGTCRTTEATAKWRLAPTDSALAPGGTTKSLTICSNKESSSVTYQRIRTSCYKHMQTNLYARSSILPAKPVITQVSSTSYESASLALASDPSANLDAPIAYYTITSSKGDVKKVNSWRELTVTVSGLTSSTSYTFTISATNADGTSPVSAPSLPVTTQTYVAPVEEPKNLYADGITWTLRTSAADNSWQSVTYGNGTFVAVATTGTGNRVMTSPDGITWTSRTSAAANSWRSVTYGNGTFVAVATTGTGNRVMTSPDGITWTLRTSAADYSWQSVTYGNGTFVAVAQSSTYFNGVMTSPDGITWTLRTAAGDWWLGVIYGNGIFVAVGQNQIQATDNRVMTSPDGITWTLRTAATNNSWYAVTYGNGTFVAVAAQGFVMTSTP
jgi:predicted RecA/RadA family phage recombinase